MSADDANVVEMQKIVVGLESGGKSNRETVEIVAEDGCVSGLAPPTSHHHPTKPSLARCFKFHRRAAEKCALMASPKENSAT